ncbi:SpoIIIAH-like family protein [Konateibacter massiliensis]|uniref:SpoIIIAH-like family protein n=1 Tax=Konateibacter massiliensis TaxID=2002841 RepID=UPI000C14F67E|nr:SpoIIIAH-like family protein [Konateibacter massiliensis]
MKNKKIFIILVILLSISILGNGYLLVQRQSLKNIKSEKELALSDANNQLTELQTSVTDLQSQIQELQAKSVEADTTSNDTATTDSTNESTETGDTTSGEAVLTSATTNVGFIAEAKLSREQVRAKNKEALLEIINNTAIADEQKQAAIDAMIKMTDIAEREAAAETLLESKGFEDVVVSITDDTADVVVNMSEVTDAKRAQIEDVMKRKTGVSAENIVITPISVEQK